MADAPTIKNKACLICIDGWGLAEATEGNAVANAETPVMDGLAASASAYAQLKAHGLDVGLTEGLMGNSEVGHLNIGSGRPVWQDIVRISKSVTDGSLAKRPALVDAFANAVSGTGRVHFLGLVSDGGVHSHIDHLFALIAAAKEAGVPSTFVHCFADGRDTPPDSGAGHITHLLETLAELEYGSIATVTGRYYAMDRDKRWDRIELAYEALCNGVGEETDDVVATIRARYAADEPQSDEFLKPIIVNKEGTIQDGDTLVFFDFRADRMRQIVETFGIEPPFDTETKRTGLSLVCMTEYKDSFDFPLIFPKQDLAHCLGEWLSKHGATQFHTAETEKYAHVTFFFNGGREEAFENEDRHLCPSPQVATYDLQPEMSAAAVADSVAAAVAENKYDFVVCNFAPPDMVGHTGKLAEAITAVAATDAAIGTVLAACQENGYVLFVTADHGNAEKMMGDAGEPFTAHTTNPVPFMMAGPPGADLPAFSRADGCLADVAPTILTVMGLPIPGEMDGTSFV